MRLGVEAALVDGRLVPGDVVVDDGRIDRLSGSDGRGRGIAVPGFVDLQVNGFAGVDFLGADADGYAAAGEALLETGVTGYLPTFITSDGGRPRSPRCARCRAERARARAFSAPISRARSSPPHRLGTHPPAARRDPDPLLLERLLDAGPVRLVTLAPELPGALELVDLLQARGIVVSLGHSDATAAEAHAAFDRGVRTVTHVFNAMRPLAHRDPGHRRRRARRARTSSLQAIVDGIHLDPDIVRLALARRRRPARARHRRDRRRRGSATAPTPRRGRRRRPRRRRPAERRRARRQRADDDRGRAQPRRARRPARARARGGVRRAGAASSASTASGGSTPGGRADVVVLDDALEIDRVLVGGETRVAG